MMAAIIGFLLVTLIITAAGVISAPTRTRDVPLFPPGPYVAEAFRSAPLFSFVSLGIGILLGIVAARMVLGVWRHREHRAEFLAAYMFLAPYLIITLIFTVGVLLFALYIAFFKYDIFTPPSFVGLGNFTQAFTTKDFLQSLVNVFWYAIVVTPIQTALALLLAVLLNSKLRAQGFFRTVMYTPSVTSSVVISMIFWWLYLKSGFLNYALVQLFGVLGINFIPVNWLQDPRGLFALILNIFGVKIPFNLWYLQGPSVTWLAIMFQNIFTTIPTFMLMFLAGLQDIPPTLYEAASIDGATGRKQFFGITLPLLRPVILLVVVLGTIGTLQIFDQVKIMTGGGPLGTTLTPVFMIYNQGLGTQGPIQMGFASGMAFILAALIFLFTFIQRRYIESGTEQY
jgi:multiple sugar transport system permease protein